MHGRWQNRYGSNMSIIIIIIIKYAYVHQELMSAGGIRTLTQPSKAQ